MARPFLFVLGMHRSGTSALAGALRLLGAEPGTPLMAPRPGDNERGFFENLRVHRLHERILADLGRTWDDLRPLPPDWWRVPAAEAWARELSHVLDSGLAAARLPFVKDPRLCRLLPLWLHALEEREGLQGRCLLIHRHPRSVAASLAARNGLGGEAGALLWLDHNLAAIEASRSQPTAVVSLSRLIETPVPALEELGRALDLDWPVPPARAASELRGFLDPSLVRAGKALCGPPSLGRFEPLGERLSEALGRGPKLPPAAEVAEIAAGRDAAIAALDPLLLGEVGRLGSVVAGLRAEVEGLRLDVDRVRRSRLWRAYSALGRARRRFARLANPNARA